MFKEKIVNCTTYNERETIQLGEVLGVILTPGDIICLYGDLGSGKTYLTKGIGRGLSINENEIRSPSFTIMNTYSGRLTLYHFDLYRIESSSEIEDIGVVEYLYSNGVSIIEWAERLGGLMPSERLDIHLSFVPDSVNKRTIIISSASKRYNNMLDKIDLPKRCN